MKEQISAYITALIDIHRHTVNMPMKNCLDNLLEFVMDIPEVNKECVILTFNVVLENENLKKRILELEESCTNMCEVEKNLQEKVQGSMDNNVALNNTCNNLRGRNEYLLKLNSVLTQRNNKLVQMNKKLRCKDLTQTKLS